MFIFPSLYEGFGLPILEAMNMSCPVACSKTSSFLEVGNEAVVYFDPNSVDPIKNALEQNILMIKKLVRLNSKD